MSQLNLSEAGILSGTTPGGKSYQEQLTPVVAPLHTYSLADKLYFLSNGKRVASGTFQVWGPNWAWQGTGTVDLSKGSGTIVVAPLGITINWKFVFSRNQILLNITVTVAAPVTVTGACFEMDSSISGLAAPLESSAIGFVSVVGGYGRRYWIVGNGTNLNFPAIAGTFSCSIAWQDYVTPDPPIFKSPMGATRAFAYSELAGVDLRSVSSYSWGYNLSAYALTGLTAADQATICDLLPRLGSNSVRLVQFDPAWNGKNISTTVGAQGYAAFCQAWPCTLWIDFLHYLGQDAYKGTVWTDPVKWQAFLAQRAQVIGLVGANGEKVVGITEINENDLEFHYPQPGLNRSQIVQKYMAAMGLPLPQGWNPDVHVPTAFWGSMPSPQLEAVASLNHHVDQHYYYPEPGIIRSGQSIDSFLIPSRAMTEWGHNNGPNALWDDSFMAPPFVALRGVELGIVHCYAFAWSQNLLQSSGAFNLVDYPNFVMAMAAASLIFTRRERGYTRSGGTLKIDTGLSYGQVGRFTKDNRIVPSAGFTDGVVLKQVISSTTSLVTVLGRCVAPNLLEKCSAVVDGVLYNEGMTII